jgi:hypothetical protein
MKIAIKKCSVNDCGFVASPDHIWSTFNGQPVCAFHFERLTNPPVNALAIRIAKIHGSLLKLGPKLGGPFVKMIAYYAMYRIFSSGGIEALAYVCYEHMLRTADAEKQKHAKKNKKMPSL